MNFLETLYFFCNYTFAIDNISIYNTLYNIINNILFNNHCNLINRNIILNIYK